MYCSDYQIRTADSVPDTNTNTNTVSASDYRRQHDNDHLFDDPTSDNSDEIERQRQQLALHQQADGSVFLLDVYETRQQYGYCSIAFSLAQTVVLPVMMVQCGVAPLQVNPMVGPIPDVLNYWGAKNAPLIIEDGEWWRLIAPMMLHAGIFHWIGNISVQLETGVMFEREWGSLNWLIIYLTSTVGASILSVIVMPGGLSVGSSGAVMGILGAKLSEIFCRACEPNKTLQEKVGHAMRKHQLVLAGGGVILVLVFSFIPFVDWAAHLGGMLTGMTVGLMIFSCSIRSYFWRSLWFLVGLALTLLGFGISLQYMYSGNVEIVEDLRNVCEYYQQMMGDDEYECSCTLDGNGGD